MDALCNDRPPGSCCLGSDEGCIEYLGCLDPSKICTDDPMSDCGGVNGVILLCSACEYLHIDRLQIELGATWNGH